MSQLPEVPQSGYKGMTLLLRGSAVRNGQTFRALANFDDELVFIIYDVKNNVLLTKRSGTGIDQSDDGSYLITIPAEEMNRQTFPIEQYKYAVRLTEGDTGERYLLQHGPMLLKDFPSFA